MQCPKCLELGLESEIVQSSPGWTTTAHRYPYNDEQGREHHHKIEITTRIHWCSKGHHFDVAERWRCWCGWPNHS